MTKFRFSSFILVAIVGLSHAVDARALTLAEIRAKAQEQIANKKALEAAAKDHAPVLEQQAIDLANRLQEELKQKTEKLPELATDAKTRLIEEVVCTVRNEKTLQEISGVLRPAAGGKRFLKLKLDPLSEEGQQEFRFNAEFSLEGKSEHDVRLKFSDPKKSLDALGLKAECKSRKRLEALAEGLPQVQDQKLLKILHEGVRDEIVPGVLDAAAMSGVLQ